jgi:hypothetical protein
MKRARISAVFTLVAAMAGTMACQGGAYNKPIEGAPVAKGPGTLEAARKYLEGRWSLVSFEVFPPGGPPILLNGTGSLVYDSYGNLKMELRTDGATAELLAAAGIPTRQGVITEEGRAVVDMQNRTLTYVIPGDPPIGAPSGALATNRPRHWQVEGDVLTLTTKDSDGKTLSVGRWQKAR